MPVTLLRFSPVIVFAVWAVVRSFGQPPTAVTSGFLALAAAAFLVEQLAYRWRGR